jgi:P-loop Domain of unknown function (DUF2791)
MSATIQTIEWLRFAEQEYLTTFIRDGGCAIKFAVPLNDTLRPDLFTGLSRIAEKNGYLFVKVSAAETRTHLVEEIFFRAAEQVPWSVVSLKVVEALAAEAGYAWVAVADAGEPLYRRLADRNQVDPQLLLLDLKKAISNKVFRQHRFSRDFRVAMTHLCIAELSGGPDGANTVTVLTDWLTGRNKAVSAVKPLQIFRKISRSTARYFFESLTHWLRLAGYPGLVMLLDAQRIILARNPHDGNVFYSKAAVLDAYEVLRQFIDTADRLQACFFVIVPDRTFLEDLGRGISAYEALKFRVFDEIRDRNLVNPMASLARIQESEICGNDSGNGQ